jgi:hypothetical protein
MDAIRCVVEPDVNVVGREKMCIQIDGSPIWTDGQTESPK